MGGWNPRDKKTKLQCYLTFLQQTPMIMNSSTLCSSAVMVLGPLGGGLYQLVACDALKIRVQQLQENPCFCFVQVPICNIHTYGYTFINVSLSPLFFLISGEIRKWEGNKSLDLSHHTCLALTPFFGISNLGHCPRGVRGRKRYLYFDGLYWYHLQGFPTPKPVLTSEMNWEEGISSLADRQFRAITSFYWSPTLVTSACPRASSSAPTETLP